MITKFEKDDVVIYKQCVATIKYIDEDYEFADIVYYNKFANLVHETVYVKELEKL